MARIPRRQFLALALAARLHLEETVETFAVAYVGETFALAGQGATYLLF
jgi:hypothetical protein